MSYCKFDFKRFSLVTYGDHYIASKSDCWEQNRGFESPKNIGIVAAGGGVNRGLRESSKMRKALVQF